MTLIQLAFANAVVLLPGALVARALCVRSASATLAWSLALVFGAMAAVFAAGTSPRSPIGSRVTSRRSFRAVDAMRGPKAPRFRGLAR